MESPNTYFQLLPKDLQLETLLYEPYPKVLDKYPNLQGNKEYWLRKAALETGQNWKNPQFVDFYNAKSYEVLTPIFRYLRVLAHYGIVRPGGFLLPGSSELLQWPEMFRHALKDEALMKYCLENYPNNPGDISLNIAEILLAEGRIYELTIISGFDGQIGGLTIFLFKAEISKIEQLYRLSSNRSVLGAGLKEFLDQLKYLDTGHYYKITNIAVFSRGIKLGKKLSTYTLYPEAILLPTISLNDSKVFKDLPITDPSVFSLDDYYLIAQIDNPEMVHNITKTIRGNNEEQTMDFLIKFIFELLIVCNYGSNIFNYLITHHTKIFKNITIHTEIFVDLLAVLYSKVLIDFAGTNLILQKLNRETRKETLEILIRKFPKLKLLW